MSRDLGAWTADAADIDGVDEVSLSMKAMAMMFEPYVVAVEHTNKYLSGSGREFFGVGPVCAPPVIGERR
jgi:hypothetical protein